jgi:excisionase family DNA binding protein
MATQPTSNLALESRWYVTPKEAARLLSLGRSTMYELVASKAIASIHVGRAVRVSVDGLREWAKSQEARM